MAEAGELLSVESARGDLTRQRAIKLGKKPIDIFLIHGAWFDETSWDLVVPLLESEGLRVVAERLPSGSSLRNFNNHADQVARRLRGSSRAILFGHSRGGDIIPRVPERVPSVKIEELGFVASALHDATIMSRIRIDQLERSKKIPRNSRKFIDGQIIRKSFRSVVMNPFGDYVDFDDALAKDVFFNTTPDHIAGPAIGSMRLQWRSKVEPTVDVWPDVPSTCLKTLKDNCVLRDWQDHRIELIKPEQVFELDTDHTPQKSAPEEVAEIIYSRVRARY